MMTRAAWAAVGVIFVLASPGAAWAQGRDALELDEVLDATARHPSIAGAEADVRAARGAALSADGAFDTSLEGLGELTPLGPAGANGRVEAGVRQPLQWWGSQVIVGWRLGLGEFPVYKGEYKTLKPQGEMFAGVDVPLLRDRRVDKRRVALGKAALEVKIAEQEVRKERLKLGLKAAQVYWKWVASGQKLTVDERLLQIALTRDAAIRERVDAGDLPEIDYDENQRAIAQRRARVVGTRGEVREAALMLSLLWRDEAGGPQVPAEDALPDALPGADQAEPELDGADRPELVSLRLKRRALELERGLAANQRLPKLDLSAKASKGLTPTIDYLDEVSVGVKVQYFLGQEVARGQEEQAEAALVRLDAAARLARDEISAELGSARVSLEVAAERVTLVERELEVARRVEQGERDRLEQGDSTLLLVNLREQATADVEKQLIEAKAAYQAARAAYRAAGGRLR